MDEVRLPTGEVVTDRTCISSVERSNSSGVWSPAEERGTCRRKGHLKKKDLRNSHLFIKAVWTMSSKAEFFSKCRWDDIYRETQRDVIMVIHVLLGSPKKANNLWGRTKR